MKTKPKSSPASPRPSGENKPTLVAFLLDRTGSMSSCKEETIKGFNGYIQVLRTEDKAGQNRFTLTQFDSISVDIIHDAVPIKQVKELTDETFQPRSWTPLYDAIGKVIRETEKQAGEKYKVLFVTLTDGQENSSTEWTNESVKKLIKEKEEQHHWTFAYIGVGVEGFAATQAVAAGTVGATNVLRTSGKNTIKAYARFAGQTMCYMSSTDNVMASSADFWAGKTTTEDE
jgi:uncharacterized protein YegL